MNLSIIAPVPGDSAPRLLCHTTRSSDSDLLDDHGDSLSHPYTHGGKSQLHVFSATHLVQQCRKNPGSRAPYRVPERDCFTIWIQSLVVRVHPPLVEHRQRLGREGLIELDQVDIVQ